MMELEALQTVLPQIRALGASLVAISPQRSSYGRAVRRRASLEFDVLSDEGLKVAKAFRPAQARLDGGQRDVQRLGDFGVREALDIMQKEDDPIDRWQRIDSGAEDRPQLTLDRRIVKSPRPVNRRL